MLHVTNGDHAAARLVEAALEGACVPWRDVLHEGPVPAGMQPLELRSLRARFIAEQGWGEEAEVLRAFAERDEALDEGLDGDEVVLWFEHDLYDQLQLIQVLDHLSSRAPFAARVTMVDTADYLGMLSRDRMRRLYAARRPVTSQELDTARRGWAAFRSSDPRHLLVLLRDDGAALPHLASAISRQLEEYPCVVTGLSRSERQAMEVMRDERVTLRKAFVASHHEVEERIFLGDVVFAAYVERLGSGPHPLVVDETGVPLCAPRTEDENNSFWARSARLTQAGREVLAGRADHVSLNGIQRWLGGVQLGNGGPDWRWDSRERTLRRGNPH